MTKVTGSNPNNNLVLKANNDNKLKAAGAIAAGTAVGLTAPAFTLYDNFTKMTGKDAQDAANFMKKIMPDVEQFKETEKHIQQIMVETGLKEKGVKFNAINHLPDSLNNLQEIIDANVPKKGKIRKRLNENYFETFKHGANACYMPKTKDIIISNRNLYTSAYHEVGHALNANGNIFLKTLQKARCLTPFGISIMAPITLAVGLFHNIDKTKADSEKKPIEKTADFVKNNAGKLTLASYGALLTEEAIASIRGVGLAKKYLPKEALTKLKGNYLKALGTYGFLAAMVSSGVTVGIKMADNIKNKNKVA